MESRSLHSSDKDALVPLVTHERLNSYLMDMGGDLDAAFALYEWNVHVGGAVSETTALVEVLLRNALDGCLVEWARADRRGRDWLEIAPLDSHGRADVSQAVRRVIARKSPGHEDLHGSFVAELSFGFWRYLLSSRYLTSLWVTALHRAFPYGPGDIRLRRKRVEQLVSQLVFVRNRAVHLEPLHRRSVLKDLRAAIDVAQWIAPAAGTWISDVSRLRQVIETRPLVPHIRN